MGVDVSRLVRGAFQLANFQPRAEPQQTPTGTPDWALGWGMVWALGPPHGRTIATLLVSNF